MVLRMQSYEITKIIASPQFIDLSRISDKDLARQRKLPVHVLIVCTISFVWRACQDELYKSCFADNFT